jgi:hypothetical protein
VLQPKSCKEAALALLVCMQQGKCMKGGANLKECLKTEDVEQCSVGVVRVHSMSLGSHLTPRSHAAGCAGPAPGLLRVQAFAAGHEDKNTRNKSILA